MKVTKNHIYLKHNSNKKYLKKCVINSKKTFFDSIFVI